MTEASGDLRRLGSRTCVRMNGAVRFTCRTRHHVGTSYCSSGVRSPEQRSGMHQAVELAELSIDRVGQTVVVDGGRARQIELHDGRLRRAECENLIVQPIELRAVAARENDARAGASALEGERASEAAARARDENRAPRKIGGRELFG